MVLFAYMFRGFSNAQTAFGATKSRYNWQTSGLHVPSLLQSQSDCLGNTAH